MSLVIVSHATHVGYLPRNLLWRLPAGVTAIFLVLSGFVLTTILLREQERTGAIDWRRFWTRRAQRLVPGHLALVAVVIGMGAAGIVPLDWQEVASSVTMTANIAPTQWTLGHTWSLAVEWQFYALLAIGPWLAGRRAWVAGAALAVIATPILRHAFPLQEWHADMVAWGVLAAYMHRNGIERPGLLWGKALLLLVLAVTLPAGWPDRKAMGATVQCAGIALFVLAMVNNPRAWVTRLGESAPVRYLGGLSMSVYLVQQLLLDYRVPLPAWIALPGIAVAALAMHYGVVQRDWSRLARWRPGSRAAGAALR